MHFLWNIGKYGGKCLLVYYVLFLLNRRIDTTIINFTFSFCCLEVVHI